MTASLADRFRQQAQQCRETGSPLTGALLDGAAGELAGAGPVRDLLAPLEADPPGSMPSLRFAGALHRLVLERRAPALALHYPSVGGTGGVEGAWAAARDVVRDERRLPDLLRSPVQTNEVGRCAVLYGGLLHVAAHTGRPVRLLEIGASAGLNLRVDAYAYEVGGRQCGDPASPVRLREPWSGALPPDVPLQIARRLGCDPSPLDPAVTTSRGTADRLTLTSYVWADQTERLDRLRGAFAVAARVPAAVERLPASAFLARELAEPVPGVATVVWHSLVWQYLGRAEREAVRRLLTGAGARATPDAPLAWLQLEPDRSRFPVVLTTWPGGQRRELGTARGHGPPVEWS